MAHLDRQRAARLMEAEGIDALLLLTAETFTYATSAPAGVATMWRKTGAIAAVVPADPAIAEGAVVSDLFEAAFRVASSITDIRINPIWVETADITGIAFDPDAANLVAEALRIKGRKGGFARPETFDADLGFQHAADILADRGLQGGHIGIELESLSVSDFRRLQNALPDATFVDASRLVAQLRMIKSPAEIEHLRTAVALSEAGIEMLQKTIAIDVSRDALAAAWTTGVKEEAARRGVKNLTGLWEYVSVGPNPWIQGGAVEEGSLIKVDVGCLISGYTSDTGRTFVCGKPTALQSRLFQGLEAAFAAGLDKLRPGNAMSAVHRAATHAIANAGFPDFTRGHFGHGLGTGPGSEEWPFLSATSETLLEPGMVLAFETPWYVDGVGGMIIEDQLLITADGHEIMNRLPRGLVSV
ncbi:Xaa-Pro aminopeptidase [Pararhizobium capsulatum DSM 1112]|uniref:Xaa-Pro aminopeptidase n=1 Tax=Pararhizobium capsulatum DSM 1112 TaxID=1121113 RepID=A0ABU0BJR7_9HYPH|nr:Xaa-Pro peptidase family protein [Pararhizobium capsulatum]MDQ0318128.1 Xaa-Pro aminopeptidase [Pararhizobium capsulatum DSM 1112]